MAARSTLTLGKPQILELSKVKYATLEEKCQYLDKKFDETYLSKSDETEEDCTKPKLDYTSYTDICNYSNQLSGQTYNQIPYEFTGLDTWPKTTNLHCWYCTLQFDTVPLFIPEYIKTLTKNQLSFKVTGVICSFSCGISYIIEHYLSLEKNNYISNLHLLYSVFTGKKPIVIGRSPCRNSLNKFGGHVTETQYKSEIKLLTDSIRVDNIIKPSITKLIEEIKKEEIKKDHKNQLNCNSSHTTNATNIKYDGDTTIKVDGIVLHPEGSAWYLDDHTMHDEPITEEDLD